MSKAKDSAEQPVTADYLAWIQRLPLRAIKTKAQNRRALSVVSEIMDKGEENLSPGEVDYLEALSVLIEAFEKAYYKSASSSV